jgi:hypothetical protein
MLSPFLFAQGGKPGGSLLDQPDFIYGSLGLAAALLVGAAAVYAVDRWRKRAELGSTGQSGAELTSFRAMHARGEITDEEYARLRQKVAARVRETKPIPAPGVNGDAPAAAAPGGTPPATQFPGPAVSGPLPPGYFDDPEPPPSPAGGKPPGPPPPPA